MEANDWIKFHVAQGNFFLMTAPLAPGKDKSNELMAASENPGIEYDEFETYPFMVITSHCGGSMLAIPRTSEDPAKAMLFINEMHINPDLTNLLAWGIEGKHYTVVGSDPKRVKPIENNSWTPSVLAWTFGNVFNVYLSYVEPENKYEFLAATKEGIPEHVANGFRFHPEGYKDIITLFNNIHYLYNIPIRTGAADPDKGVAAMRAEVDAAGFQELKAAVIENFQRWLEEKELKEKR